MKSLIITIDTEGDNLWAWKYGNRITTENVKYLPRFQHLCDEFGFKPVWLTNFEMVSDPQYVNFSKQALREGRCEIGMHLHAVNNPPVIDIPVAYPANFPYLIEYPEEVMREKIIVLHKLLEETYEEKILSHRAGRWAMNRCYTDYLIEMGYKVDCSVTPGNNWNDTLGITLEGRGSDYSKAPEIPFFLDEGRKLLEIPVSIRTIHYAEKPTLSITSLLRYGKHRLMGYKSWLRPNGNNLKELLYLVEKLKEDNSDYLMFMLHSSELMPGGSPTFNTCEEIEHLYEDLKKLFSYLSSFCEGITLKEYSSKLMENKSKVPYVPIF